LVAAIGLEGMIVVNTKDAVLVVHKDQIPLVKKIVNDFEGTFTTRIDVEGPLKNPELYGSFSLNESKFTVDYLQTRYSVDHTININKDRFLIKDLVLYDHNQNTAKVNGVVNHDGFSDFELSLDGDLSNFNVLNTEKEDNETFYGTAYASGAIKMKGPIEKINLITQLKSEKNTFINLPIQSSNEYMGYNFIRFTNSKEYLKKKFVSSDLNMIMDMNMELTEDAQVQIIFDEQQGDIMKGRGTGNLQMKIDNIGQFKMYGNYRITQGDYLFTAINLFKKRFIVSPGSTIQWTGNPYEAKLDIEAYYSVMADPSPLLSSLAIEDDLSGYEKVPTKALVYMDGSLFAPTVSMDFEIESSGIGNQNTALLEAQLQQIRQNEQERNKQVASLIVMNRFLPVNEGITGQGLSSTANSTVGDFVSNQLTNLPIFLFSTLSGKPGSRYKLSKRTGSYRRQSYGHTGSTTSSS